MTETLTISAASMPDWSIIDEEILCPLCDYNLRGLPEPRCPECGYRFDWPDLIDPTRRKHPFVFEHHPGRNAWSFYRTLRAGLRPTRFWRKLHPAQPASLNRLVKYVVIVATIIIAANIADAVRTTVRLSADHQSFRAFYRGLLRPPAQGGNPARAEGIRSRVFPGNLSVVAALDVMAPPPWSMGFARNVVRELGRDARALVSGIYLIWPVLTLAALLIFRWSMRTAKVRTIHVFRCIAYAFDATVWVVVAFLCAAVAWGVWGTSFNVRRELFNLQLFFVVVALLVMTYRLYVGYKVYLQFDRPLATAVASQVIVGLVMMKLVSVAVIGA